MTGASPSPSSRPGRPNDAGRPQGTSRPKEASRPEDAGGPDEPGRSASDAREQRGVTPGRYAIRPNGMFAKSDAPPASGPQPPAVPAGSEAALPPTAPEDGSTTGPAPDPMGDPLLDPAVAERLRDYWRQVQYDFVDDPRDAVKRADVLLERAGRELAEAVNARSAAVRRSWQHDGETSAAAAADDSTERLRRLVRQYRAVLERVLRC